MTIVGDRPEELEAALEEGLRADLLVVSGGLGPTHDDRTVELLARAAGRELVVDPSPEQRSKACRAASPSGCRRPTVSSRPA